MTVPDLYQVLGVSRQASTAAINAAYRRKAKTAHPDAGGQPEDFRILKMARDILADPDKRKIYDDSGDIPEEHQEENRRAQVYVAAADLLLALIPEIKNPNYEDVLARLRQAVGQRLRLFDQQEAELEKLLKKLSVVANRLQPKAGENVLRALLLGRADDLRKKVAAVQRDREINEKLLEFLAEYTYYVKIETVLISNDV